MLGKLMKYEMQAMGRVFLPLYGALIILAILNRVLISLKLTLPIAIGGTVYGLLMGGICVLTLVLTLQRFSKSLLGNEGYLMFTLPVSTDNLILSKLFSAFIWSILSALTLGISIVIISAVRVNFFEIIENISIAIAHSGLSGLDITLFSLEFLVIIFLMGAGSIIMFYACISLSLLVNKRKGLFSFGAFIAISILWNVLSTYTARFFYNFRPETFSVPTAHVVLLLTILFGLISFFALYFVTRYMLTRKLNLE